MELIEKAYEFGGSIDVLVNNAGTAKDKLLIGMKADDYDYVMDTCLRGSFFMLREAAKHMIKQRSGSIVNISSVVGLHGNAGQTNYSSAKAGIIGLTKTAAKELSGRGIRVNAIAPGMIDTDMTAVLSDNVKEAMIEQIPLGYVGNAKDIANMVVFLCSKKSRYITGQVISVDGGMSI
jgi:Dehydrogenases with different specificities (related to short-chain alcohol dehydrogenases)